MTSGVDGSKRKRDIRDRDERYAVRSAGGPLQVVNRDSILYSALNFGNKGKILEDLSEEDLYNLRLSSRFGRDFMEYIDYLKALKEETSSIINDILIKKNLLSNYKDLLNRNYLSKTFQDIDGTVEYEDPKTVEEWLEHYEKHEIPDGLRPWWWYGGPKLDGLPELPMEDRQKPPTYYHISYLVHLDEEERDKLSEKLDLLEAMDEINSEQTILSDEVSNLIFGHAGAEYINEFITENFKPYTSNYFGRGLSVAHLTSSTYNDIAMAITLKLIRESERQRGGKKKKKSKKRIKKKSKKKSKNKSKKKSKKFK